MTAGAAPATGAADRQSSTALLHLPEHLPPQ
jgi:hypothetical protein